MHTRHQTLGMLLLAAVFGGLTGKVSAQWLQKGGDIDGTSSGDYAGSSISMPDSNTIAVGANGHNGWTGQVRIFRWDGSAWGQKGGDINGANGGDQFGRASSMPDSNTIAIGAYLNDDNGSDAGEVQIFRWNGSAWVQKGSDINGEAAGDWFGHAVSMPDSNTVAIGAERNDGNGANSGHVRVYRWNGSAWVQKGTDIDGEAAGDRSGWTGAVSMPDSNTVAIGAPNNDGNGNNSGHVRIYQWNGSAWIQKGNDIDGEAAGDSSGFSVSMPDANTVAIGAIGNDGNGNNAGHVRVYQWNGSAWIQKGGDIDGEAAGDESGYRVSMPTPNTVAIGARYNDGNGTDAGHVRVYQWNGSAWVQKGLDIDGEGVGDRSGFAVSMPDSNTVAISAYLNDGNGIDAGHVRVFRWNSPPLQVGFAWFYVEQIERDVVLQWATATERGSDHFRIERATSVIDGGPMWRLLGTVPAAGQSSELRSYRFVDRGPHKGGVHYYRIVEVGADGTLTKSPVRKLHFRGAADDIAVRPNPFTHVLEVLLPPGEGMARVQVEDSRGVIVHQSTLRLTSQVQRFRIEGSVMPAGTYTIRVLMPTGEKITKVVKK